MQNRIKVKARASLKIAMLDAYMRIYSLPRSSFYATIPSLVATGAMSESALRKDTVAQLVQLFDPVPILTRWTTERVDAKAAAAERRGEKRSAIAAGLSNPFFLHQTSVSREVSANAATYTTPSE